MAATADRFYEFVGGGEPRGGGGGPRGGGGGRMSAFEGLFAHYEEHRTNCIQMKPLLYTSKAPVSVVRRPNGTAGAFGWITADGVYCGQMLFGAQVRTHTHTHTHKKRNTVGRGPLARGGPKQEEHKQRKHRKQTNKQEQNEALTLSHTCPDVTIPIVPIL